MRDTRTKYFGRGSALALLMLILTVFIAVHPLVAQEPGSAAHLEECQRKLLEVQHAERRYQAEGEAGWPRYHHANYNFLNFGCTWDMFAAAVTAPDPVAAAPVAVAMPTATPGEVDPAFLAECQRKRENVAYAERRYRAEGEAGWQRYYAANYNFENYGCTWDMFEATDSAAVSAAEPVAAAPVAVAMPTATPGEVDPAFLAECQRKRENVAYAERRYRAEGEAGWQRYYAANYNFENFGCTWDMFEAADAAAVTAAEQVAAAPVAAARPTATPGQPDPAFLAECERKLQAVLHAERRYQAEGEVAWPRYHHANYNFLNYGCTWDMFG